MKVLVLGLNYAPEPVGIAVYTSGMAEGLVRMGHEVRVIAGQPHYPSWRPGPWQRRTFEAGVQIRRVRLFVPHRLTGLRRALHQASFALAAFFPLLWQAINWRPDVVIAVAPALLAAPAARLCALLCGAKSWLHVHDLEIEAAVATGQISGTSVVRRIAGALERTILGSFDRVSTISRAMAIRIEGKGIWAERLRLVPNWADLQAVRPLDTQCAFRRQWGIETPHVALYSGSLGRKQGMEMLLRAADILRHRDDLTFVICTKGPQRRALEEMAAKLGNVQVRDLQPADRLNELLGLATVHLLPQIAGVADLLLPSKLGNMLASGRPIVAAAAGGTELHAAVDGCGIAVAPGDPHAMAEAITRLLDDPALRSQCGQRGRQRAETDWNRERIMARLDRYLEEAVGGKIGLEQLAADK